VAAIAPAVFPGSEALAPNLANVGVRLYHGELDNIVPAPSSRAWQRSLLDLGIAASYLEYAGVRHNAWDLAYRNGAALDWLAQFRRNRSPDRVRFVAASYRYRAAYWVAIDGLDPGKPAEIDARRGPAGAVTVRTRNLDGFTLTLDRPANSVTIDDKMAALAKPASTLSFMRVASSWRPGRLALQPKHAGAEGPIVEAVQRHVMFVYGSAGVRTSEELEERQEVAHRASTFRGSHMRAEFAPAVKVDSEVTDADIAAFDLVLFGTPQTNLLIRRFAASLPMALAPGAADYGLLFVAPLGPHYVMVNSGLPWWSNAGETSRPGYGFAPEPLAVLGTMGDYLLFKGSLSQVVAEGRFDRNWRLPAEGAARLTASGTVTIQVR
jgi:hypothetical protein